MQKLMEKYKKTIIERLNKKSLSIILGFITLCFILGLAYDTLPRATPQHKAQPGDGIIDSQAASTQILPTPPNSYTVLPGDTLSIISQKIYGNMDVWQKIAELNKISNVENIEIGTVLVLPAKE